MMWFDFLVQSGKVFDYLNLNEYGGCYENKIDIHARQVRTNLAGVEGGVGLVPIFDPYELIPVAEYLWQMRFQSQSSDSWQMILQLIDEIMLKVGWVISRYVSIS